MGSCTLSNLLGAAMRCKYSSGRFSCVYKCVCMSTVYMSYIYMTYITNHVNRDTFSAAWSTKDFELEILRFCYIYVYT